MAKPNRPAKGESRYTMKNTNRSTAVKNNPISLITDHGTGGTIKARAKAHRKAMKD